MTWGYGRATPSGALTRIDPGSFVSTGATWSEDIYIREGAAQSDLTGLSFQLQFRSEPDATGADLTLSTADGTLSIEDDPDTGVACIVRVTAPAATIGGLAGPFVADLVSKDTSGVLTHWAHGVITFTPSPIAF